MRAPWSTRAATLLPTYSDLNPLIANSKIWQSFLCTVKCLLRSLFYCLEPPTGPSTVRRPSWSHRVTRGWPRPLWASRSVPLLQGLGWHGCRIPPLSPSWTLGRWRGCSCRQDRGKRWGGPGRSCWWLRSGSGCLPGSAACRNGCWGPWRSCGWASGTVGDSLVALGWTWRVGRRPGCQDTELQPGILTLELIAPMSLSEAGRHERRG